MENKNKRFLKRTELVVNYLKNPYNLQPHQESLGVEQMLQTSSVRQFSKTMSRRMFHTTRPKALLPQLNGSNAFYLAKTSQQFRQSLSDWKSQLQVCLQSKQVNNCEKLKLGQQSKVQRMTKHPYSSTSHLIQRQNRRVVTPKLEIQVQRLF